jgi:hypothetical protein
MKNQSDTLTGIPAGDSIRTAGQGRRVKRSVLLSLLTGRRIAAPGKAEEKTVSADGGKQHEDLCDCRD